MIFRYYPRYVSLVILIIFNILITAMKKQASMNFVFYGISVMLIVFLFGDKYILSDDAIIRYFFFIKKKVIKINDIKMVEIATVKKIGTINIYIGKKANKVKEDGYYLIMSDNSRNKVHSGYQNKSGITLGNYIISRYKNRNRRIEKYKLFSDTL